MRVPRRVGRLGAAALVVTLVLSATPGAALGWANNGDSYGTHDWFIDQAVRILDGRAAGVAPGQQAAAASSSRRAGGRRDAAAGRGRIVQPRRPPEPSPMSDGLTLARGPCADAR